ncbi:MAG: aminoacyl-histidine dipeptidase [Bacteroidetes bacterium]|nr:aminoacyl-histidine dipeptidase [Bacteroidota bacterium]HET6243827.1 aminoacyl-histidine dipeptidase [Bacteroidia bacterium]
MQTNQELESAIKLTVNSVVRALEPKALWNYFADLNAVPRPSKKEERVIQFIKDFGNSIGLDTMEDEIGNVIIKKASTPGMEQRETILLQSHLDMVHQKNNDTLFDFDLQGIQMELEGDWVRAKGTTLGADNGIGVATIMALLASKEIAHPAIEALFTIDEETGMTGALNLKAGLFSAKIMLNLDTEDDTELTIGCAGGIDVTVTGNIEQVKTREEMIGFKLTLKGLTGGHSGMDIHKGRANANKLMNGLLLKAGEQFNLKIASIDGGSLRNAIPRESVAVVALAKIKEQAFLDFANREAEALKMKFKTTDPNLSLLVQQTEAPLNVIGDKFQGELLSAIKNCPNGVYSMSPDIDGLVQTSNNLARVLLKDTSYTILCLTRSSVDVEKMKLAGEIKNEFEQCGSKVELAGNYPGWTPKPDAKIASLMSKLYREMFDSEPHVNACHAGLECGIIGGNYPGMEMISFGPNITGAHSPDEKVQISSVQKYWSFLLETLKRIPLK